MLAFACNNNLYIVIKANYDVKALNLVKVPVHQEEQGRAHKPNCLMLQQWHCYFLLDDEHHGGQSSALKDMELGGSESAKNKKVKVHKY